ncbi:hypothetical protein CAL7716_101930 (plasmid) [Calothrix sp. PCC 7716]|nr:hypothetical protein CAL7716_101930 [Calothrix sp. PCC 7716]
MEPTKQAALVKISSRVALERHTNIQSVAPVQDIDIDVPTNIELIKPLPEIEVSEEEAQYLEQEYLLREENNQYYHMAYSQY